MLKCFHRVKFLVSNKTDLVNDKVNKWLNEHCDESKYYIQEVRPMMSYDDRALMIGCLIHYIEFVDVTDSAAALYSGDSPASESALAPA